MSDIPRGMSFPKAVLCLLLLGMFLIPIVPGGQGYTDDFSTGSGWTTTGNIAVTGGHLTFNDAIRTGTTLASHQMAANASRTYDVNYTLNVATMDFNSRFTIGLAPAVPTDTTLSAWGSDSLFQVVLTGYGSNKTFNYYWNTTSFGNTPSISEGTIYHVSMGMHQLANSTYMARVSIWTSGGTWNSPDIGTSVHHFSFVPDAMQYFLAGNQNTNVALGHISGYIDDYSDTFYQALPPPPVPTTINLIMASNPILGGGHNGEPNIIMDGSRMDCWFASGNTLGSGLHNNMWYSYTTNADLNNFAAPVKVLPNIMFPTVVRDDSTGIYYCFASKAWDTDVFMWSSTDKVTWTPMNSGNPVVTKSSTPGNQYYHIFNTAVIILDGTFHMWIDSGSNLAGSQYIEGYSYSSTTGPLTFDSHKTQSGPLYDVAPTNPVYVPERHAFIIFGGRDENHTHTTYIKAWTVSISDDLTQASSYHLSENFNLQQFTGVDASDPTVAFTKGAGNYEMVMQWYYGQPTISVMYQGYSQLTAPEFYDALVGEAWTGRSYWAPTWTVAPPITGTVGVAYEYIPLTNESSVVASVNLPSGAVFNYATVSWTPAESGTYSFALQGYSNDGGLTSYKLWNVTVSAANGIIDNGGGGSGSTSITHDTDGGSSKVTVTPGRSSSTLWTIGILALLIVVALIAVLMQGNRRRKR